MDSKRLTYFAETDFRGRRTKFGIKDDDRNRHVYVIGKTGMGKSTLLENMAIQDIQHGRGLAFIDPHGSTAEKLLDYVPEERIKDVIYFAPFDLGYPISFNVMEDVGPDQRHLVVSGLMSAFKKIWVDAWSARMEYILQNTLLALLEYPNATLLGVNRLLSDKDYRSQVVANVTDSGVRSFWLDEFAKYTERMAAEAVPAIQNKIGQFTANPLIRNIIGQPRSSFDFRRMMDERRILVVNLSKGLMGESNANLLGSMLITKIYLAAMSRANIAPTKLREAPPFYFFVDEFQSFANESFANILSEARKYKLSLTIAHQYIEQMSEEVRAAVFGNVGTLVSFRIGPFDAEVFEKVFSPTFMKEDMVNLGFAQIYLTMMIDGVGSPPFSAVTLPPIPQPAESYRREIMDWSRRTYAKPRVEVETAITAWHESGRRGAAAAKTPTNRSAVVAKGVVSVPRDVLSQAQPGLGVAVSLKTASKGNLAETAPPAATAKPASLALPGPPGPRSGLTKVTAPPRPAPTPVVSLADLKQSPPSNKHTGRHAADLRAALLAVQKEVSNQPPSPPQGPALKQLPRLDPTTKVAAPPTIKETPKEVPEEVLKKMLQV